jgi:hypothetical protein
VDGAASGSALARHGPNCAATRWRFRDAAQRFAPPDAPAPPGRRAPAVAAGSLDRRASGGANRCAASRNRHLVAAQLLALDGLAELVKVVLGFRQIGLHQRAAGVEELAVWRGLVKTAQLLQTLNNQLSELAAQVAPLAEHATLSPPSANCATVAVSV